jgi:hypothetical protein
MSFIAPAIVTRMKQLRELRSGASSRLCCSLPLAVAYQAQLFEIKAYPSVHGRSSRIPAFSRDAGTSLVFAGGNS